MSETSFQRGSSFNTNNNNYSYGDFHGSSTTGSVRLAGDNTKDHMYEPKHHQKAVRVLTVIAYVFFVSLAAIMLSLYYIFLWKPLPPAHHSKILVVAGGMSSNRSDCQTFPTIGALETPKVMPMIESEEEKNSLILSTTTEMNAFNIDNNNATNDKEQGLEVSNYNQSSNTGEISLDEMDENEPRYNS